MIQIIATTLYIIKYTGMRENIFEKGFEINN